MNSKNGLYQYLTFIALEASLVLKVDYCKILSYPREIRITPHFFNRRCNRIELKFTSMCTKEENYTRHFDTHANWRCEDSSLIIYIIKVIQSFTYFNKFWYYFGSSSFRSPSHYFHVAWFWYIFSSMKLYTQVHLVATHRKQITLNGPHK